MFTSLFVTNYRTTLAGVVTIVGVIAKIVSTGHVEMTADGAALATGLGLIFAHDSKAGAR